MASSPRWKIYDATKTYRASTNDLAFAAAGIGLYGEGATIRDGHTRVCWTEGPDGIAFESYDTVANTCLTRATPTAR